MGKRTIIFYAPVGTNLPVHLLGGGEKGCRRTREILSNAGYNVITIDKATMSHGAVSYVKSAIHAIAKTKKKLHENPDAILYIVGFYEKNLPLEWILINSGEKKRKTIYEARNGRLVKAYKEKGNLYKKLMDSVLKRADVIFAQGLEYVDFIKKTYGKKAVYTPNYVLNRSLKPYIADRPFDTIRLIYFGRVSESKNVDVVIKVAYELEKAGYKTSTTVIGGYTEAYKAKLEQTIKEYRLDNDKVQIIGQQPFDKICDALQKVHFFVFPSQEKMEGHSNSLTEAMTFGVVPVVSTAGFNASSNLNFSKKIVKYAIKEKIGIACDIVEWHQPFQFEGADKSWLYRKTMYPMYHKFFYKVAPSTKNIIAISNCLREHFVEEGCNTIVVPIYVDIDKRQPCSFSTDEKSLSLIYPGNPYKKDDFESMIGALTLLSENERKRIRFRVDS